MANKQEYVKLGLFCANICKALKRQTNGRDPSESMREAISELEAWVDPTIHVFCSFTHNDLDRRIVAEIHEEVMNRSGRHRFLRFLHSGSDKEAIPEWNSKLHRILLVFNVCSAPSHLVSPSLITLLPGRGGYQHQHWRCQLRSWHGGNWSGRVENGSADVGNWSGRGKTS